MNKNITKRNAYVDGALKNFFAVSFDRYDIPDSFTA
jgi:hypothetical protein